MSSPSNSKKREEAIAYLKARGKHLLSTSFKPTSAANTDVKATIDEYKRIYGEGK